MLLLEGTYLLDTYGVTASGSQMRLLSVSGDQIRLQGQGPATVLKLADDTTQAGYSYQLLRASGSGLRLQDLVIDGNQAENSLGLGISGLALAAACTEARLQGVTVRNCSVGVASLAERCRVTDCDFSDCSRGYQATACYSLLQANRFQDCGIGAALTDCSGLLVYSQFRDCTEAGLDWQGGSGVFACCNQAVGCPLGLRFQGVQDGLIQGNLVQRTAAGNTWANGEIGLGLQGCNRALALFNRVRGQGVAVTGCTNSNVALSGADWNLS